MNGETRSSAEIGELVSALAAAQLEFSDVKKSTINPFYKSKYADLAAVIEATQPALAKHGLVVIQFPAITEEWAGVDCVLAHKSGQWLAKQFLLPMSKIDAQGAGSALTYARRYGYQAIIGVAADEDDDANAAVGGGSKAAAQAVAQRKIDEHNARNAVKSADVRSANKEGESGRSFNEQGVPSTVGLAQGPLSPKGGPKITIVDGEKFSWLTDSDSTSLPLVLKHLKVSDPNFMKQFMQYNTVEGKWYVLNSKAFVLEDFITSIGGSWEHEPSMIHLLEKSLQNVQKSKG